MRTIVETVDHDGNGERVVTDHGPGDRSTSRTSRFRTEVNEDGTYDTPTPFQDDDAPESHKRYFSEQDEEWQEAYEEAPNWPESITGETLPPDPGGDISGGWTEWCAATKRDKRPGGVESVADGDDYRAGTVRPHLFQCGTDHNFVQNRGLSPICATASESSVPPIRRMVDGYCVATPIAAMWFSEQTWRRASVSMFFRICADMSGILRILLSDG